MVSMERLIVICEGGLHTVEYLQRNGVYPAAMVIEPSKFQDMSPYLSKDDDILLIIKGLTDFTMASVYGLLNKFKEYQEKYKRVTIMTNIPLGNVDFDYYLYEGDIFYGNVQLVSGKKKVDIDVNGGLMDAQKKSLFSKGGPVKAVNFNPIMYQYRRYNNKRVKLMIYGKVAMNDPVVTSSYDYEEKVKVVDLYNKK